MQINQEEVKKMAHLVYLERTQQGCSTSAEEDYKLAEFRWIKFDYYRNQYKEMK